MDRLRELVPKLKTDPSHASNVLVVDFGGQHADLTARRVFELGYRPRLVQPHHILAIADQTARPYQLIIAACNLDCDPSLDPRVLELEVPVLGICNGHQLIATCFGSQREDLSPPEIGVFRFSKSVSQSVLLQRLPATFDVRMFHRQKVSKPTVGRFRVTGSTARTQVACIEDTAANLYGVQFHPESSDTQYGSQLLQNFLSLTLPRPGRTRRALAAGLMRAVDSLQRLTPSTWQPMPST
jgi:GMP synthase (glutamine-hydrolysing)